MNTIDKDDIFHTPASMKNKQFKPAAGKILISDPFQKDFYFKRSVVLLADHNEDGTFGLIMNKPVEIKFNEVLKEFSEFDASLYLGGPVKTDSLFFIHSLGSKVPNSMKILEGIYWGGDIDIIKEMIIKKEIESTQIRFFLGYAGWGPHQLEDELDENYWVVSTMKAEQLFKNPPDKMWENFVKKMGTDYAGWVNFPTDPSLN
jgi:putative transcriptional regulator